jgi:hypothetical protein
VPRGSRVTEMDDETTTSKPSGKQPSAKDEHAYEDSWYRSLKALAEARKGEPTDEDEDEEAPPAGP